MKRCDPGYYCVKRVGQIPSNQKIPCGGDDYYCPGGNSEPLRVPDGMCGKGLLGMRKELVSCGNMAIPSPIIVAQTQYPGTTEATVLVRNDGGAPISVSLQKSSDSSWIEFDTAEYEINEGLSAYIKVKLVRYVDREAVEGEFDLFCHSPFSCTHIYKYQNARARMGVPLPVSPLSLQRESGDRAQHR